MTRPHIVALLHGSRGMAKDMRLFLEPLRLALKENSTVVNLQSIERKTHAGIRDCGEHVAEELRCALRTAGGNASLSVVGYSMGGLVLREALAQLREGDALRDVALGTYCSIATPHCGARNMRRWWMRPCGEVVALVSSQTYKDLLHPKGYLLQQSVRPAQLEVWSRFEHRLLVTAANDKLVPYQSSSLSSAALRGTAPGVTWVHPHGEDTDASPEGHLAACLLDAAPVASAVLGLTAPHLTVMESAQVRFNAHRAIVCKAPCDAPHAFGWAAQWIAKEIAAKNQTM